MSACMRRTLSSDLVGGECPECGHLTFGHPFASRVSEHSTAACVQCLVEQQRLEHVVLGPEDFLLIRPTGDHVLSNEEYEHLIETIPPHLQERLIIIAPPMEATVAVKTDYIEEGEITYSEGGYMGQAAGMTIRGNNGRLVKVIACSDSIVRWSM